jgi:hypothetical protein
MRRTQAKCQHPMGDAICGRSTIARGFCTAHYAAFRAQSIRNGTWDGKDHEQGDQEFSLPKREPWTYAGREGELGESEVQKNV